jgi:YHS domain-containing protein
LYEVKQMVRDPVCGMLFDKRDALAQSQYRGKTFYFCCLSCKTAFDSEPAKFSARLGDSRDNAEKGDNGHDTMA